MEIAKFIEIHKEEMTERLRELVKIRSVREPAAENAPYGEGNRKVLLKVLEWAEDMGFDSKNIDFHCGHAEIGEGDEYISVMAHLDVVDEGSGWSVPPYDAVMKDNKIYGRGTCDNKNAAIVSLYALKYIKESGLPLERKIRFIFGCNEESGMSDMDYYFSKEPLPVFGIVPDSFYAIVAKEKGVTRLSFSLEHGGGKIISLSSGKSINIVPEYASAEICLSELSEEEREILRVEAENNSDFSVEYNQESVVLHSKGIACHGATPKDGKNAAANLFLILGKLNFQGNEKVFVEFMNTHISNLIDGSGLEIACSDEFGDLTLNLGIAQIDEEIMTAKIDIRYPYSKSGEALLETVKSVASKCGIDVECMYNSEPLNVDTNTVWIDVLKEVYMEETGKEIAIACNGGGTYARKTKNRCVSFGSAGTGAHGKDEHIDIDGFMNHFKICTHALLKLATIKG